MKLDNLTYDESCNKAKGTIIASSTGKSNGFKVVIKSFRHFLPGHTIHDDRDDYHGEGHFTAYVEIPKCLMDNKELEDLVHGGISWSDKEKSITGEELKPRMCMVGWDYAHYRDDYVELQQVLNDVEEFTKQARLLVKRIKKYTLDIRCGPIIQVEALSIPEGLRSLAKKLEEYDLEPYDQNNMRIWVNN